jgi:Domain of unknown function (DUF3846)
MIEIIRPGHPGEVYDGEATLAFLKEIVGGYIEVVYLIDRVKDRLAYHLVLNEEGKLKDLPYNQVATMLCHAYAAIDPNDWIVGTVVLLSEKDVLT